jgi:hypothetical protein
MNSWVEVETTFTAMFRAGLRAVQVNLGIGNLIFNDMKIDEKTKQELINEALVFIAYEPFTVTHWKRGIAEKIVSYVLEKLNVETVSEAEARSERN